MKQLKALELLEAITENEGTHLWLDDGSGYPKSYIYEAIEELEALQNKSCKNCIYGNKNMIKDKIVCDICVSINRKGIVDKTFYCNKWESK